MDEKVYFAADNLISMIDAEIEFYKSVCPDEGEGISEWDDGFISGMIKIKGAIRDLKNDAIKRKQFEEAKNE